MVQYSTHNGTAADLRWSRFPRKGGRNMNEAFLRTEMLLGSEAMERLAGAHVAVFGLGGVGS